MLYFGYYNRNTEEVIEIPVGPANSVDGPSGGLDAGQAVPLDLTGTRPGPVTVTEADDVVIVVWPDETGRDWLATFSLDPTPPPPPARTRSSSSSETRIRT